MLIGWFFPYQSFGPLFYFHLLLTMVLYYCFNSAMSLARIRCAMLLHLSVTLCNVVALKCNVVATLCNVVALKLHTEFRWKRRVGGVFSPSVLFERKGLEVFLSVINLKLT